MYAPVPPELDTVAVPSHKLKQLVFVLDVIVETSTGGSVILTAAEATQPAASVMVAV